ncbi:MAG: hypothetical protein ABIQ70_06240 [Dokdonella sp.]
MLHAGWRLLIAVLVASVFHSGSVRAKDAFVVISGGGSPNSNHYSQYLQSRAYVTYLKANYPADQIWVFFGAGNVTGQPPVLSDVEQIVKDDRGRETTTWIAGGLPGNRPARRTELARAFRDEILPTVSDGGTLYLFVGDHGAPSTGVNRESIISLWSWDRDPTLAFGWRNYDSAAETLGVAELRRWLSAGLGHGRVVFVMSQCFSGGFHYLGVPREAALNPSWFTRVPAWASAVEEPRNMPLAAGFTATDDHSVASGCTSDVSADHWAGYERYLPENLLGLDLFTLRAGAKPERHSFYQAHREAVLADQTIDKPGTTSEQYLEVWADAIERLAKDANLTDAVKAQMANYRNTMNGKTAQADDAAFKERRDEYRRFIDRMVKQNPALADLTRAPQPELERTIKSESDGGSPNHAHTEGNEPSTGDDEQGDGEDLQLAAWLWVKKIAPAWAAAIDSGEITDLSKPVAAFERDMASIETRPDRNAHRDSRSMADRRIGDPSLLVYFHGGYADPATFDPARARSISDWAQKRKRAIVEWAKKSTNAKLRATAETYALLAPQEMIDPDAAVNGDADRGTRGTAGESASKTEHPNDSSPPQLKRSIAAARIYAYRQVLAAWQFLLAMHEKPALERVTALTQLERTPLPRTGAKAQRID